MAVIEVHELHKRYGDTIALDGISLEVRAGEVFGLLGPNGAGKTTAVEIIEGLRRADSGAVRVLDLDPGDPELRQRVGVQLQQAQLPEKMRVGEALELYAGFYRDPRPVPELLDEWGLTGKRNAAFRTLSGGQQRRDAARGRAGVGPQHLAGRMAAPGAPGDNGGLDAGRRDRRGPHVPLGVSA
jgi:ABC-2 type transport system ATP-binding protein